MNTFFLTGVVKDNMYYQFHLFINAYHLAFIYTDAICINIDMYV